MKGARHFSIETDNSGARRVYVVSGISGRDGRHSVGDDAVTGDELVRTLDELIDDLLRLRREANGDSENINNQALRDAPEIRQNFNGFGAFGNPFKP